MADSEEYRPQDPQPELPSSGPPHPLDPFPPSHPMATGNASGHHVPALPTSGAGYPVASPGLQQAPFGFDPLTGRPYSDKSKVVAGVLQLLLGGFGAGRFYTGHIGIAIAQMAVGWGVCFLMLCLSFLIVPAFFAWVGFTWAIVDGMLLLARGGVDAQGRVLRT